MGDHVDNRGFNRKKIREHDESARFRRNSFKQYLNELEEQRANEELDTEKDPESDDKT